MSAGDGKEQVSPFLVIRLSGADVPRDDLFRGTEERKTRKRNGEKKFFHRYLLATPADYLSKRGTRQDALAAQRERLVPLLQRTSRRYVSLHIDLCRSMNPHESVYLLTKPPPGYVTAYASHHTSMYNPNLPYVPTAIPSHLAMHPPSVFTVPCPLLYIAAIYMHPASYVSPNLPTQPNPDPSRSVGTHPPFQLYSHLATYLFGYSPMWVLTYAYVICTFAHRTCLRF